MHGSGPAPSSGQAGRGAPRRAGPGRGRTWLGHPGGEAMRRTAKVAARARMALSSTIAAAAAVAVVVSGAARPAFAWDPATTQAGLPERAVLASSFHRVIA